MRGYPLVYVTINFILHKKYLDFSYKWKWWHLKSFVFFKISHTYFRISTSLPSSEPWDQWLSAFTNAVTLWYSSLCCGDHSPPVIKSFMYFQRSSMHASQFRPFKHSCFEVVFNILLPSSSRSPRVFSVFSCSKWHSNRRGCPEISKSLCFQFLWHAPGSRTAGWPRDCFFFTVLPHRQPTKPLFALHSCLHLFSGLCQYSFKWAWSSSSLGLWFDFLWRWASFPILVGHYFWRVSEFYSNTSWTVLTWPGLSIENYDYLDFCLTEVLFNQD